MGVAARISASGSIVPALMFSSRKGLVLQGIRTRHHQHSLLLLNCSSVIIYSTCTTIDVAERSACW